MLDELIEIGIPVGFDFQWRPAARESDDDLVIETAIDARGDFIATFDIADMAHGAARFGIEVQRPAVVLGRIRE